MDERRTHGARPDWVLLVANRWQVVAGRRFVRPLSQLGSRVTQLLTLPPPETPLERLLFRGFLLELQRELGHAFRRCRDRQLRLWLLRLIERLDKPSADRELLSTDPSDALKWIGGTSPSAGCHLAQEARAAIDLRKGQRLSLKGLARLLHSNERYVRCSFTREFGLSPTKYLRQCRTEAIVRALRADAASVKEIAAAIGCAEATVRRLVRAATGCNPRQVRGH